MTDREKPYKQDHLSSQSQSPQQQQNPNNHEIQLDNDLLDLGVTRFIKQGNLIHIHIEDGKGKLVFNITPKNYQTTVKRFRSAAEETKLFSPTAISNLEKVLTDPDKKYLKYLNPEADPTYAGGNGAEEEIITYATVYEYDSKLYEAVKIGELNCFLEVADPHAVLDKTKKSITDGGWGKKPVKAKIKISNKNNKTSSPLYQKVNLVQEIVLSDTEDGHSNRVLPLPLEQYFSDPYIFNSKEEFDSLLTEVRKYKNVESLYFDIKDLWYAFTQGDDESKTICAADVVFTYFQDLLCMTHYLLFTGKGNAGKSTNLILLHLLAYRNIISSNTPSADLFSFAGNFPREAAYTFCDSEVTNLEKDPKKMQVLRDGYYGGIPNHRMDTTFGRHIQHLKSYFFKAMSMNKLPNGDEDVDRTLQRCLTIYGKSRIQKLDAALLQRRYKKDSIYAEYKERFRLLRNKLLLYRTLHYFDDIPEVELNIYNRERQLFISIFSLFQNTKKALKEIEIAASKYTNENRQTMKYSLEAVVYRAVIYLAKKNNTNEIKTTELFEYLRTVLSGVYANDFNTSFECVNFGNVTLMRVLKILKEDFTAQPLRKHGEGHETIRGWKVDLEELEHQDFTYNPELNIKVYIDTNNTPKNGSGFSGFRARKKFSNKIKNLKSSKSAKSLTQKYKHNGTSRKLEISKKNRGLTQ